MTGRPSNLSRYDLDPVVVERRIAGDLSVPWTIAEREECVRRLHARGLNDRPIAFILGITDRTVLRIRHRLGLAANPCPRGVYPHGSLRRYRRDGCRCDQCRAANSRYCARYARLRRAS